MHEIKHKYSSGESRTGLSMKELNSGGVVVRSSGQYGRPNLQNWEAILPINTVVMLQMD